MSAHFIFPTIFWYAALTLAAVSAAVAQPAPADERAPYGGVTPAPNNQAGKAPQDAPPAGSIPCITGGQTDPCVLTGQNSRYRTSVNVHEPGLAGLASGSNFGMTQLYEVNSTPPTGFNYEPVVAQPLYVTNVGGGDLLFVVSLNDYIYAFDTGETSETVTPLWSINLAQPSNGNAHCGTSGYPFINVHARYPGAVLNLPYYGAVATPVIDLTPSPANSAIPPIAYVVTGCTSTFKGTSVKWFLDAIDLSTGTDLASAQMTNSTFMSPNELSRAALLLNHPSTGGNYVYVAFAAGVSELGAATGQTYQENGAMFNFSITYRSSSPYVSFGTPIYWETSGATTSSFPSAYTQFNTSGSPLGPPCTNHPTCDHGDNWAVNGGGIWMSGKGPSSDASAYVYAGAGNGPFGCKADGTSQCTNAANVSYWGESAVKFTSPTATTPSDFFAPHDQHYSQSTDDSNFLDPSPAPYQTEELSRMDQDFGLSGIVLLPMTGGATYAMTSDKSGYVYLTSAGPYSLGGFQIGDVGLTSGSVTTQLPFQGSRNGPNNSTAVCPVNNDSTGIFGGTACDEIHELAWFNNNMFAWPANESVETFLGTATSSSYTFPTSPTYDPCLTLYNCTPHSGVFPSFPPADASSAGGLMALAANTAGESPAAATLWSIVPQKNGASAVAGTLYAYTVNSDSSLTELWTNVNHTANPHHCASEPATGWFSPSFTEPTLAAGTAYVATSCAETGGTSYTGCATTPSGAILSGVLAFSTCP